MGGQNHQPTNRIQLIAPSAWLSKQVGDGFRAVLEANSYLENAIISAMDRLYVEELVPKASTNPVADLTACIEALENSLRRVADIDIGFENLLRAADREGYTGNPLAASCGELGLKARFSKHLVLPAINDAAWNDIESRVQSLNVLGTLRWEREQFRTLVEPTHALLQVMNDCLAIATRSPRAFIEAVECNGVALRQRYAQVFSRWNYLHVMFLYSALVMTELFYRSHEYESLTAWSPTAKLTQHGVLEFGS